MKKYIVILVVILLFIVGCSKKEDREELVCEMPATTITLTVQSGKIVKYVDEVQGEFSKEKIKLLNESYLKDVTNTDDAIVKLRGVIASNGGDCK